MSLKMTDNVDRALDEITEGIRGVNSMLQTRNVRVTVRTHDPIWVASLNSKVYFGYGRSQHDPNVFCLKVYAPNKDLTEYSFTDLIHAPRDIKVILIEQSVLATVVSEIHRAILAELTILGEKKDVAFRELDRAIKMFTTDTRINACSSENTGSSQKKL